MVCSKMTIYRKSKNQFYSKLIKFKGYTVPLKRDAEVPTPHTSEHDLIWK